MSDIVSESEPVTPDDTFTPEEKAYFEGRGGEKAKTAPVEAEETEAEADSGEGEDAAPEPAETKEEAPRPKTVPHAALHEERARRKEAEEKFREADLRAARYEERVKTMLERFGPSEPQTPPAGNAGIAETPDPEADPIGGIKYAVTEVQKIAQERAQREAAEKQNDETRQFVEKYQRDAESYTKTAPDFFDAYNHLKKSRADELISMGLSDAQARAQLVQEEFQVAQLAYQNGRNPADVFYETAKLRGYAKKAEPAPATNGSSVEERLNAVEAGQAANKSLSATGGKSGGAEITPGDLLDMSDAEFDRWAAKHPRQARKFLGGP